MGQDNKVVASCRYNHPVLGAVKVKVNGSSRSIRARWVGPVVQITIPRNLPVNEYDEFIHNFSDKILECRPEPMLAVGRVIDACDVDFSIIYSDSLPARYRWSTHVETDSPLRGKVCNYNIRINPRFLPPDKASSPRGIEWLNTILLHVAAQATSDRILPVARRHAEEFRLQPAAWVVKESKTRLGCCDSKGVITLSPRLIFLPQDLRDYIIFHELAHLSEMNHSQAFHDVCDSYCGGNEKMYEARVRNFKFPVF